MSLSSNNEQHVKCRQEDKGAEGKHFVMFSLFFPRLWQGESARANSNLKFYNFTSMSSSFLFFRVLLLLLMEQISLSLAVSARLNGTPNDKRLLLNVMRDDVDAKEFNSCVKLLGEISRYIRSHPWKKQAPRISEMRAGILRILSAQVEERHNNNMMRF